MTTSISRRAAFFAAALLTATVACADGKFNKVLQVGQPAPAFAGALGVDGKTYGLDSFKDAKAVLVVFTCNHCPVASAYVERFKQYTEKYRPKGVAVVAISVNPGEADGYDAMKTLAAEEKLNYVYAFDESQKSAKDFGAQVTPQVYLLDGARKVAYMGAFDDDINAEDVKKSYAIDATEAVLAGKTPETAETKPLGCGINYVRSKQ